MPSSLMDYFAMVGFGPEGWGLALLTATAMTVAVSICGFITGAALGALVAWAKLSRSLLLRAIGDTYTTVLRGVPDLLVIYLFYFGGSTVLGSVAGVFGAGGFIGMPAFITGMLAIGVVSAAYQAEVFRGAYQSVSRGELEAARAVGMPTWLMARRIVFPLVLRYAIPGIGNTWQLVLKESALISVTGLVELMRMSHIAAGSTRKPLQFYLTAIFLYLAITWTSSLVFRRAEARSLRGVRRAL